jgi:deazaflavin-dependent oxidoreductase (nitroreductase family)
MATQSNAPKFFQFVNRSGPAKLLNGFGVNLYRFTGGLAFLPAKLLGISVLVLTTTGRKTGKQHRTGMTFIRDGDNVVVSATGIAKAIHPAWYLNLKSNPRAMAQIGWRKIDVLAEEASPSDRVHLMHDFPMKMPERFQAMLAREIPVMILRPVRRSEEKT